MHKITVITPPDKVFNNNFSFLLVYPNNDIKQQFQDLIADIDHPFNVYYYEQDDLDHNVDWLLSLVNIADCVIFDIDNTALKIRTLASYIIAQNNTFWLTNDNDTYYNKLSTNRIYNLDFIKEKIYEKLQ
jgi:hypothetical protein